MKKTKFFAVVMAAVMTLSMVACGEQTGNDVTPTTAPTTAPTEAPADPTATPVPAPQNVTVADASITFEDGNFAFVDAWMDHARSAKCDISLVDYNGSKAIMGTRRLERTFNTSILSNEGKRTSCPYRKGRRYHRS